MMTTKRYRAAVVLNLLVPGTGLILLRREWLGLASALLFGLCLEVALFCALISPLSLPFRVQVVAWVAAASIWAAAQLLLRTRLIFLTDPDLPVQIATLRQRAAGALEAGNLGQARGLLRLALAVDDEDPETNACWARLLEALGKPKDASRVWRRLSGLSTPDRTELRASDAPGATAHRPYPTTGPKPG